MKTTHIYLILLILFTCCKKEKEQTELNTAQNDCSNSSSESTEIYGVLDAEKASFLRNGNITHSNGYNLFAFFTTQLFHDEMVESYPTSVYGGKVKCNGDSLDVSAGTDPIYINYSNIKPNPPFIWHVEGSPDIPAFTYKNCAVTPSYTGYNLLPDTVHLNQDLVINLTGVSNADAIYAEIGGYVTPRIFLSASNTFTVSASDLQQNPPTQWQQYIKLWFQKRSYIQINSKSYKIQNSYQFCKDSVKFVL